MTVNELIQQLEKFDGNEEVWFCTICDECELSEYYKAIEVRKDTQGDVIIS